MKVSTLLGMPAAEGLFHRAVIQSGPGLQGVDREKANEFSERILGKLGIGKHELHRLQTLPFEQLTASVGDLGVGAPLGLAPVS